MIFLLDTNAVSEFIAGRRNVQVRLASLAASDKAFTCSIVRGELLYGVSRLPAGSRKDDFERRVLSVLKGFSCAGTSIHAGTAYAEIRSAREKAGRPMADNDLWIAATAISLNATLVSHDANFLNTPELKLVDWF